MVTVVEQDNKSKITQEIDLIVEDTYSIDESMHDQIPEFIREEYDDERRKPQLDPRPMLPAASIEVLNRSTELVGSTPLSVKQQERESIECGASDTPPTDELEALWPGVHHELIQPAKRTPSFYMMLGFMAGAVLSLVSVWGYSAISTKIAAGSDAGAKQIVVAGATKADTAQAQSGLEVKNSDPNATLVPISNSYQVKPGDTLVMIAMKNYKKVTPRLLDEIVKANGMKSANVLSLGQTLNLPAYKPQSSKIAASPAAQIN